MPVDLAGLPDTAEASIIDFGDLPDQGETSRVRIMNYGPVAGEYHHSAMYGPVGNKLEPYDVAVSPNLGLQLGDWIDVAGKPRRVADWSYIKPGKPTENTIEIRDGEDQGYGPMRVLSNDEIQNRISQMPTGALLAGAPTRAAIQTATTPAVDLGGLPDADAPNIAAPKIDFSGLPDAGKPSAMEQIGGVLKKVADKIGIPTSLDDITHELDLLGLTQPTSFPLPRAFPEQQQGVIPQVVAGIANLPADIWNFATSPAGVALGGVASIGPLVSRAVALGFTADQIRQGLKANNLQDQVELALGAGLGAAGALHGAPVESVGQAPRLPTESAGEAPALQTEAAPPVVDLNAVAAANQAGANAIAQQTEAAIPAEGAPSVAQDQAAAAVLPETQTAPEFAGAVSQIPTEQIASRPDLMQFKRMDETATGTNAEDAITAPYDPIKAGNLLLWEPINPNEYGLTNEQKYIVANGHHRNAAAQEQGVPIQNAQILRESAGYSAGDARTLAAETNIADGKGTIFDQAKFIREYAATHGPDAALGRAGQIGARGRKAASIALNSAPDLYASFVNEQVTPDAAATIADAAPGNDSLQRLGIQRALKGDEPAQVYNFLQAVKAGIGEAAPDVRQVDLFASDDAAIKAAENAAQRAGAIQREIGDQINAVAGAARRPEKAAALGVNISDPASVNAKLDQLRVLRERARNWAFDPQIRDMTLKGAVEPQEVVTALTRPESVGQPPRLPGEGPAGEAPALQTQPEPVAKPKGYVPLSQLQKRTYPSYTTEQLKQMARSAQQRGRDSEVYKLTQEIKARESGQAPVFKTPQILPGEKQGDLISSTQKEAFALTGEKGVDYEARQKAADDANAAAHEASIWEEQNQIPFGFGPGAAAIGENLSVQPQIKQLTQIVSGALRSKQAAPATARLAAAVNAASKTPAVTPWQRRMATLRASTLAVKNAYLSPPRQSDFLSALKDWQGADQRASFNAREFAIKARENIDPLTREAVTNYIQADGDHAVLTQRAAASSDAYRPGYEAALNLTPDQQTFAANVRQYFDAMLQDGINAGFLDHGLENYITQVWKRPNKITKLLQADLQAGRLQKNFNYARQRIFSSFFEGEQAGYTPATKDVSGLIAAYDLSFNRSLSARAFIKALREAKAPDGEPVTRFSGAVQPLPRGDVPPEAYLIRSRTLPKSALTADGRPYRVLDHPALRGWKLVVQDGAAIPAYYQADMLVHPDHFDHLNNVLKTSAFRQGKFGAVMAPIFKAGAIAKQTRLSLSIFHLDQEGLHGLFHRVNPANLERINFDDPKQWALVRNGLQVADYSAMELFSEGLRGGGLVSKIPILGELQNRFNEFLFKDYIPRLKMTMALHALDRNVARYPKLAPEVLAELTANQANAPFGELNYKLIGRDPTVQDLLRLITLAPDFLEGRAKFVGQALKPYGREQRTALILGAVTMYVTARALNQWLDNDPHWNKPFSVIYNGREYRLRTVMGDVSELVTDPRRFFYNRLSPWLKTGVTWGTGRDYRGIKLTTWEKIKDTLQWLVPIPLGGGNEPTTIPQRILGSAGVSNKPAETPIDQVYKGAIKFKQGLTDPKIRQEVRRAQQETYAQSDYSRLNRAMIQNDKETATSEIVSLMKDKGKTPADLAKYYSNFPMSPFTGSRALDWRWLSTMTPVERAQYQKAVNMRINMARSFFGLLPSAIQQSRK